MVGWGAATAVVAGSLALSSLTGPEPRDCPEPASPNPTPARVDAHRSMDHGKDHGSHHGTHHETHHGGTAGGDDAVTIGPTCNQVEMAGPGESAYVPDIAAASVADRRKAQRLLDGVNEFCDRHSGETLAETWRPGPSSPPGASHHGNPDSDSRGLDPANPRTALIYDGELGGVMFVGRPLPSLGSIPRAHSHDPSTPTEMLHVYCTTNLREAFTPNRQLGIKADLQPLRQSIRPAVMDLDESQLRAVLARVRGYAGDEVVNVTPVENSADGGPDPVLQAMRTEIRRSLLLLDERQLRKLRSLIRSY